MKHLRLGAAAILLLHCGSDDESASKARRGTGGSGGSGLDSPDASMSGEAGAMGKAGRGASGGLRGAGGIQQIAETGAPSYPDAFDPSDSPPKIGEPGCGFEMAAFCDTFGGGSAVHGRAGELDAIFWSGSRGHGQHDADHATAVGMAVIPNCRPDLASQVWPEDDTLICNPTFDVNSGHLLVGAASQYYGQNGYRIRQPFDFTGRTGKIVLDATATPLGPLFGWVSVAITQDPISSPGYSIENNNEGSIIPKNAVEVHFANAGDDGIRVYYVQVFDNFVDTIYAPPNNLKATYKPGKLNHIEILVSDHQIQVLISPYSEDGVTFGAPTFDYTVNANLAFTRGYVHLSVHNHASLKYTQPDSAGARYGIVDAVVAQMDNVGFDGPVVTNWREYEVPDSLVEFNELAWPLPDPHNPENLGYDLGYFVGDIAAGPKQTLTLKDVKTTGATSARVSFTGWVDWLSTATPPNQWAFQVRMNGKDWHERKFTPEELALISPGPTTLDENGAPVGAPGTQGRFALMVDVPLADLVDGDNTLEFVTSNVPMSYPPFVANVDLLLKTN